MQQRQELTPHAWSWHPSSLNKQASDGPLVSVFLGLRSPLPDAVKNTVGDNVRAVAIDGDGGIFHEDTRLARVAHRDLGRGRLDLREGGVETFEDGPPPSRAARTTATSSSTRPPSRSRSRTGPRSSTSSEGRASKSTSRWTARCSHS